MNNPSMIYVVDDDESVCSSVQRLLRSAGYDVLTFCNAQEFLTSEIESSSPSCMILDVNMPGKNGLELQEELSLLDSRIPIVFMSGHGNVPDSVKAMKMGALDFLSKPFEDEELLAAVNSALDQDKKRKETAQRKDLIQQKLDLLTPREYEVLRFVISGMLNKQIAAALDISEKTVKVHRARIFEKTGTVSLAQLVRLTEFTGIEPVAWT